MGLGGLELYLVPCKFDPAFTGRWERLGLGEMKLHLVPSKISMEFEIHYASRPHIDPFIYAFYT